MVKNETQKMSAIVKKLAMLALQRPARTPSSEAIHAALLLVHVAWNRSLGFDTGALAYGQMLAVFTSHNPAFWSELRSRDAEALIGIISKAKGEQYALDRRVIVVCGMREENVHIEWCYEHDYPTVMKLVQSRLGESK